MGRATDGKGRTVRKDGIREAGVERRALKPVAPIWPLIRVSPYRPAAERCIDEAECDDSI